MKRRVSKRRVSKRRVSKRRVSKRSKKKFLKGGAAETPKEINLLTNQTGIQNAKLIINDETPTNAGTIILKYINEGEDIVNTKEINLNSGNTIFNSSSTITITIKEEEEVYNNERELIGFNPAEKITFSFDASEGHPSWEQDFELVKQRINPPSYVQAFFHWMGIK